MESIINTGLIPEQRPLGTDYLASAEKIPYQVNVKSGNWTSYLPTGEVQYSRRTRLDAMACVTFSLLNSIEIQARFYGVDLNLSDRYLATKSETSHSGNYFNKVVETLRKFGVPLEDQYPTPESYTWDEYYSQITKTLDELAIKFLDNWEVKYQWLDKLDKTSLKKALKQAPVQIASATCLGWHTDNPVKACSNDANHATVLYGFDSDDHHLIQDTYIPFTKVLASDYKIKYGMQAVLFPKKDVYPEVYQSGKERGLLLRAANMGGYQALLKQYNQIDKPTIEIAIKKL